MRALGAIVGVGMAFGGGRLAPSLPPTPSSLAPWPSPTPLLSGTAGTPSLTRRWTRAARLASWTSCFTSSAARRRPPALSALLAIAALPAFPPASLPAPTPSLTTLRAEDMTSESPTDGSSPPPPAVGPSSFAGSILHILGCIAFVHLLRVVRDITRQHQHRERKIVAPLCQEGGNGKRSRRVVQKKKRRRRRRKVNRKHTKRGRGISRKVGRGLGPKAEASKHQRQESREEEHGKNAVVECLKCMAVAAAVLIFIAHNIYAEWSAGNPSAVPQRDADSLIVDWWAMNAIPLILLILTDLRCFRGVVNLLLGAGWVVVNVLRLIGRCIIFTVSLCWRIGAFITSMVVAWVAAFYFSAVPALIWLIVEQTQDVRSAGVALADCYVRIGSLLKWGPWCLGRTPGVYCCVQQMRSSIEWAVRCIERSLNVYCCVKPRIRTSFKWVMWCIERTLGEAQLRPYPIPRPVIALLVMVLLLWMLYRMCTLSEVQLQSLLSGSDEAVLSEVAWTSDMMGSSDGTGTESTNDEPKTSKMTSPGEEPTSNEMARSVQESALDEPAAPSKSPMPSDVDEPIVVEDVPLDEDEECRALFDPARNQAPTSDMMMEPATEGDRVSDSKEASSKHKRSGCRRRGCGSISSHIACSIAVLAISFPSVAAADGFGAFGYGSMFPPMMMAGGFAAAGLANALSNGIPSFPQQMPSMHFGNWAPQLPSSNIAKLNLLQTQMQAVQMAHNQVCQLLGQGVSLSDSAMQTAQSNLDYQLQRYRNVVAPPSSNATESSASSKKRPAGDSTSKEPPTDDAAQKKQAKRGRKTQEEQTAHNEMMKMMALGLFTDSQCRSLYRFCEDKEMGFIRHSLSKLIKSEPRLEVILRGKQRLNPERAAEAVAIIEKHYPTAEGEQTSEDNNAAEQAAQAEEATRTIFSFDQLKTIADALDWGASPRMSRDGTKQIPLHDGKQPSELLKFLIFDLANRVMSFSDLDKKKRKEVLKYAATLLFYDHGYKSVYGISNLDKTWGKRLENAYEGGSDTRPLRAKIKGPMSYTNKLEKEHPGYIRQLYRYAEKTIGNQASFPELARTMNEKSRTYNDKPETKFNSTNLWRWFKAQGGDEKSPKEKPYLTEDQKKERVVWCEKMKEKMAALGKEFYACFLDEKWFYTTSRRRKIKILPPGPDEDPEEVKPYIPTTISRRHSIKAMFLAVISRPYPEHNFDGKIYLSRVAREEKYKRTTHNQNLTDDATANGLIKDGEWYDEELGVLVEGMTLGDLQDAAADHYDLDDDIRERLVLRYYRGVDKDNKPKARYIDAVDGLLPIEQIRLGGYTLMARYAGVKKGKEDEADTHMVDVSCDSQFMKDEMPKVGKAIRDAYHWVPRTTKIYLFLDNAGGHGTKEVVDAYVKALEDDWNVICIHQRPRSPATNMLDLGVWMAFQNIVEKMHFRKRKEANALANTVEQAWEQLEPIKLENVWQRWVMVLDLIIEDNGGNAKVESKRGKLFRAPSGEAEVLDDQGQSEADDIADADTEAS